MITLMNIRPFNFSNSSVQKSRFPEAFLIHSRDSSPVSFGINLTNDIESLSHETLAASSSPERKKELIREIDKRFEQQVEPGGANLTSLEKEKWAKALMKTALAAFQIGEGEKVIVYFEYCMKSLERAYVLDPIAAQQEYVLLKQNFPKAAMEVLTDPESFILFLLKKALWQEHSGTLITSEVFFEYAKQPFLRANLLGKIQDPLTIPLFLYLSFLLSDPVNPTTRYTLAKQFLSECKPLRDLIQAQKNQPH